MALIEIENLSVTFTTAGRKVRAVQDVSFKVEAQQSFGLVGESGSGKSTILRAICGMAPITGGQIRIDGKPLPSPRGRAFAAQVQMVFQDPFASLNPYRRLKDQVAEPIQNFGLATGVELDALVLQLFDRVRLPRDFMNRYPHELSGGQRQRVGIARAIALEPDFILADEIVSGLDVSSQAQVLNLLERLVADLGMTLAFISHDLSVVRRLCQRVMVLQHGQIVENRETAALFADPQAQYTRDLLGAIPLPDPDQVWS